MHGLSQIALTLPALFAQHEVSLDVHGEGMLPVRPPRKPQRETSVRRGWFSLEKCENVQKNVARAPTLANDVM